MATSSILGGSEPAQFPSGRDIDSLGPSDSSDSGSDVQSLGLESDTDAAGTGERPSVEPGLRADGADILPDHISIADEQGVEVAAGDLQDIAADEDEDEEGEDDAG